MHKTIQRIIFLCAAFLMIAACSQREPVDTYHNTFTIKSAYTTSMDINWIQYDTTYNPVVYKMTVFYPENVLPTEKVPVVLLLDGFWYREMMENEIVRLIKHGQMPKVLLVSLDYETLDGTWFRQRDLVYPYPDPTSTYYEEGKQGDLFYQFIQSELFPYLEANYPVDPAQRYLLGHSLGGLFTLYSTLDNSSNPLFKGVVGASCSTGMYNNYLFDKEKAVYDASQNGTMVFPQPIKIYMGVGVLVGNAFATHQAFYDRLASRNYPNVQTKLDLFEATHTTDSYLAFREGLIYLFND